MQETQESLYNGNQLLQEREVIHENVNQITRLSDEFAGLAGLQEPSEDLNHYQTGFVNAKRINLRHNLVNLKEGLQIHYNLGETVLRPLISLLLLESLEEQHTLVLNKLADINTVILNLSPMGMLFNCAYLKQEIDAVCRFVSGISCQESSLFSFVGICRDQEPV